MDKNRQKQPFESNRFGERSARFENEWTTERRMKDECPRPPRPKPPIPAYPSGATKIIRSVENNRGLQTSYSQFSIEPRWLVCTELRIPISGTGLSELWPNALFASSYSSDRCSW